MKSVLINYTKLFRKGFFIKSTLIALLIIVMEIIGNQIINDKFDEYYMLLSKDYIMFSLRYGLFIFLISEVSRKKYVLVSMLPMKIKDYISITYFHGYLVTFMILIGNLLVNMTTGRQPSKISFVVYGVFLIGINIFYPFFASPEMKLGANQRGETTILIIVMLLVTLPLNIGTYLAEEMSDHQILAYKLVITLILVIASIATVKKSYNNTVNKILVLE
ncbi:MAG: hypothetical protein GX206_01810 [Clostridiales bacterium]|nr:hypothetical protein [Clostridiales bacterium]